jgi:2,3-bisphosphoglycerate-independent phosphoglycerate mutase
VHAFTDGRDTPPQSAAEDLANLRAALPANVKIATVIGRYYAMDRDKRWDRVSQAYAAMTEAKGAHFEAPEQAIEAGYAPENSTSSFRRQSSATTPGMKDGDAILCFNFRADRVREILAALLDPAFDGFPRGRTFKFSAAVGMTRYSDALALLHDLAVRRRTSRPTFWVRSSPARARPNCAWRRPRSSPMSRIS